MTINYVGEKMENAKRKLIINEVDNGFILQTPTGLTLCIKNKDDLAVIVNKTIHLELASEEEVSLLAEYERQQAIYRADLQYKISNHEPITGTGHPPLTAIDIIRLLMDSTKYGGDIDRPEGNRYLKISNTFAEAIIKVLRGD